jgi:hypothetical protein
VPEADWPMFQDGLFLVALKSFFSLLESRLDRVLYRRRVFPTLYGCRQFINYHMLYYDVVTFFAEFSLSESFLS